YIATHAAGYYKMEFDKLFDEKVNKRHFPLFGLGVSYHNTTSTNFYANFSQAYSGVNFNDIRVLNPNFRVDPGLKDVTGCNFDFGYRGTWRKYVQFDIGGYYMAYNDRIGVLTKADENFNIYRYRTNIADSRSIGIESFAEFNIFQVLARDDRTDKWTIFHSMALTDARYIKTETKSVLNKKVEYAPSVMLRIGSTYKIKGFSGTLQYSYVSEQFTDATNARFTVTGINGVISAYHLLDFSAAYQIKKTTFGISINNALNRMYFTRRADGYPGPGIIPSDGRSFFFTAAVRL
ncbi:MAG: TonB-dependent receptor, partial [Bacteroidota bacterium]|nr:TonB-dependent receptor [Bacteroidota bacterium]